MDINKVSKKTFNSQFVNLPKFLGVFDTEPTNVKEGDFYFNPSKNTFQIMNNGEWLEVLAKAPTPIISIASSVFENSQKDGSFSICSTCNLTITADFGSISNVDYNNHTFTYTAPNIDNAQNLTDYIRAYADGDNYSKSDTVIIPITVIYVPPYVSDDLISNDDFSSNANLTQNIEI